MAKTASTDPVLDETGAARLVDQVADDYSGRCSRRRDLEKQWAEIDRQIGMVPETSHKQTAEGNIDANKRWMPESELPLQAQTLEMLATDSRRLKFPKGRDWFVARAALTQKYLDRYSATQSPIPNDQNNEGSTLAQDNADRLAAAMVSHWHRQYDFRKHWDLVDGDAFKYSFGVGRLVKVKARMLSHDASAIAPREQQIPVFVPRSAKNVYLDDSMHAVMHEGFVIGPNIIQRRTQKLHDVLAAARAGGADPNEGDGGWRMDALKRLVPDENNQVTMVELEGDILVHNRDSDVQLHRNVLVTVAIGANEGKGGQVNLSRQLVRFRRRHSEFCSYLISQYHNESVKSAYGTSPLMKGMPIARAAAQSLNRLIMSGQLKIEPPVGYSRDDVFHATNGGLIVYPGAQWPTTDKIEVHDKIGGEPSAMLQTYLELLRQYYDVTGVNAPRLGAQTKSHTTAFAKDAELTQGSARTVDYVDSCLEGPMERLLMMEYRMGLECMGSGPTMVYVDPWNEFVELRRAHLPDVVVFKAIGASAPASDNADSQKRVAAAQLALQIDAAAVQLGREPSIDHGKLVEQVLRQGGWTDTDAITTGPELPEGTADGPPVGASAAVPGVISQGSPILEAV